MKNAKLRQRTLALIAGSDLDRRAEDFPAFRALIDYAMQNPGLEYRNYGEPTSYRAELRGIAKDLERVQNLARAAIDLGVTDADLIAEAPHAFSGRLSWTGKEWDYCTGQYWPTEYRKAVAALLDRCCHNKKLSKKFEPLPDREYSIAEMKEICERTGSYFFQNSRRGERKTKLKGNRIKIVTHDAYSNGGAHVAIFQFNPATGDFRVED